MKNKIFHVNKHPPYFVLFILLSPYFCPIRPTMSSNSSNSETVGQDRMVQLSPNSSNSETDADQAYVDSIMSRGGSDHPTMLSNLTEHIDDDVGIEKKSTNRVKSDPVVDVDYKGLYLASLKPTPVKVKVKRVATEKQKIALAAGRASRKGRQYKTTTTAAPVETLAPPPTPPPPPIVEVPMEVERVVQQQPVEYQQPPVRRLSYRVM